MDSMTAFEVSCSGLRRRSLIRAPWRRRGPKAGLPVPTIPRSITGIATCSAGAWCKAPRPYWRRCPWSTSWTSDAPRWLLPRKSGFWV